MLRLLTNASLTSGTQLQNVISVLQLTWVGDIRTAGYLAHYYLKQSAVDTQTNVTLHGKLHQVAFWGPINLKMEHTNDLIDQTGDTENRNDNDSTYVPLDGLAAQQQIDRLNDNAVRFEQTAKGHNLCTIRNPTTWRKGKLAYCRIILPKLFYRIARQRQPQLHETNTRHLCQWAFYAAVYSLTPLRLYQISGHLVCHRAPHLNKKFRTTCFLAPNNAFDFGIILMTHCLNSEQADVSAQYPEKFDGSFERSLTSEKNFGARFVLSFYLFRQKG